MDVERVNYVLEKAIVGLQIEEIEAMVEWADFDKVKGTLQQGAVPPDVVKAFRKYFGDALDKWDNSPAGDYKYTLVPKRETLTLRIDRRGQNTRRGTSMDRLTFYLAPVESGGYSFSLAGRRGPAGPRKSGSASDFASFMRQEWEAFLRRKVESVEESYYYGSEFAYKPGRWAVRNHKDRAWVDGKMVPVRITGAVFLDNEGDIEETEYKQIVRLDTKEKLDWRKLPNRTLRDIDSAMLDVARGKAEIRRESVDDVPGSASRKV